MDPSEPGERCLPEMGLSGWMKRTMERSYDLSDFCNSPPVDGFYYPTIQQQKGNNAGVAGKGNCSTDSNNRKEEVRDCTVMGGVMSINQPHQPISQHFSHVIGSNAAMYQTAGINGGCNAITGGEASAVPDYLKPVVSGFSSAAFSKQLSLGLSHNQQNMTESPTNSEDGKDPQSSPEEMRSWANAEDGNGIYRSNDGNGDLAQSHPTDDSAPTGVEDRVVSSRFTPTVARRTNPFFTGSSDDDKSSTQMTNWLFRPGKKAGDGNTLQPGKLYEAKVEFQQQPNSKIAKKTVRYVPRPSELREMSLWSPTSM